MCKAAVDWEAAVEKGGAEPAVKKARTTGAAEHSAGVATHARGTVHQLLETPEDVLSLKRLGPDTYEGSLRSGAIWRGDEQLLTSLPQGVAKLATLRVRESVEKRGRPKSQFTMF